MRYAVFQSENAARTYDTVELQKAKALGKFAQGVTTGLSGVITERVQGNKTGRYLVPLFTTDRMWEGYVASWVTVGLIVEDK